MQKESQESCYYKGFQPNTNMTPHKESSKQRQASKQNILTHTWEVKLISKRQRKQRKWV